MSNLIQHPHSYKVANDRHGLPYTTSFWLLLIGLILITPVDVVTAKDGLTPLSPDEMQAVLVADNVYVLHGVAGFPNPQNRGLIANLGFIVTEAGVVLVDTGGSDAHAEMLLAAVAKVTDKPVVAAFNTHVHGDHWLGNDVIKQRYSDVRIYAHPKKVESATVTVGQQWVDLLNGLTGGHIAGTVPQQADNTVIADEIIEIGGSTFTIIHNGAAHTDNDIMIHVQPENVVFLGDNAFNQRMGRMDDGNFRGNIDALNIALELSAGVYVPGHGPATSDVSSAQHYRDYLQLLYDETASYFEEGLSDFEIKDLIIDKFEHWAAWPGFEEQLGRHISLVYLEIEENAF